MPRYNVYVIREVETAVEMEAESADAIDHETAIELAENFEPLTGNSGNERVDFIELADDQTDAD